MVEIAKKYIQGSRRKELNCFGTTLEAGEDFVLSDQILRNYKSGLYVRKSSVEIINWLPKEWVF